MSKRLLLLSSAAVLLSSVSVQAMQNPNDNNNNQQPIARHVRVQPGPAAPAAEPQPKPQAASSSSSEPLNLSDDSLEPLDLSKSTIVVDPWYDNSYAPKITPGTNHDVFLEIGLYSGNKRLLHGFNGYEEHVNLNTLEKWCAMGFMYPLSGSEGSDPRILGVPLETILKSERDPELRVEAYNFMSRRRINIQRVYNRNYRPVARARFRLASLAQEFPGKTLKDLLNGSRFIPPRHEDFDTEDKQDTEWEERDFQIKHYWGCTPENQKNNKDNNSKN